MVRDVSPRTYLPNNSRIPQLATVTIVDSDELKRTIHLPEITPRFFRYMQFAKDSTKAIRTATPGPYIKNDKKTIESEKLIVNFECGSVRLIRGAKSVEKARTTRKPHPNVACTNSPTANARHTNPESMTIPFTKLEIWFLSIGGDQGKRKLEDEMTRWLLNHN